MHIADRERDADRLKARLGEGLAGLDRYRPELAATGVPAAIERARGAFAATVSGQTARGNRYDFGAVAEETGLRLYALVREAGPKVVVETGVCNGVSTALILAALDCNGAGHLHSIDHPEHAGTTYGEETFWAGKQGAVVPRGQAPGWVVPASLRSRWTLRIGRSQDELLLLLRRLGTIDFFFHDSEHSDACMRFEYEAAWIHLRSGGVLVSDDTTWNDVFGQFCADVDRRAFRLGRGMACVIR
jgi:predicted O-methyltransferase YrrM